MKRERSLIVWKVRRCLFTENEETSGQREDGEEAGVRSWTEEFFKLFAVRTIKKIIHRVLLSKTHIHIESYTTHHVTSCDFWLHKLVNLYLHKKKPSSLYKSQYLQMSKHL